MKYGVFDANHLLHRVCHIPALQELVAVKKGEVTISGPTYGFLRALRSSLYNFGFDIVVLVWDGCRSERRLEILSTYKDRGVPDQDALDYTSLFVSQVSILEELIPKFGVRQLRLNREADDVIAKVTSMITESSLEVTVVSEDSDFFQLVNTYVSLYRPISEKFYDVSTLCDEFKMSPIQLLWAKAIAGDGSDNIPGIKGVGWGTASKVAKELEYNVYPSINGSRQLCKDRLEQACTKVGGRAKKVIQSFDTVVRNFQLVDLSKEEFSIAEMSTLQWIISPDITHFSDQRDRYAVLNTLCDLQMDSIVNQFETWFLPFRKLV